MLLKKITNPLVMFIELAGSGAYSLPLFAATSSSSGRKIPKGIPVVGGTRY